MTSAGSDEPIALDDEPISVPDSGDAGDGGKLKMIVSLVKKCLGVKDIASMSGFYTSPLRTLLTGFPGDFRCPRLCSSPFPT